MRLWDWALRAYAAPGVKAALLDLQDNHGQSVCLLLWAAWAVSARGGAPSEVVARSAALARTWETSVIGPLRTARRGLKAVQGLREPARDALRERVQADELAAEQRLLEALEALTPAEMTGPADALAAIVTACAAWDAPVPRERLEVLAAALPSA